MKGAPGKRATLKDDPRGQSIRIGYDSKRVILAHALELSAERGQVVTLRQAADDIIFRFEQQKKRREQRASRGKKDTDE